MRPIAAIVAATGLIALSAGLFMAGRASRDGAESPMQLEPSMAPQVEQPAVEPRPQPVRPTGPGRAIRPEVVAPPQVDPGELVRVEPREPLTPIGMVDRHGSEGPKPDMLYRPVAVAAGVVESGGYTIRLAGLDIVEAEETCTSGGIEWRCGVVARTAFRNYLRGRALSCLLPDAPEKSFTLSCMLGSDDPAMWLARYGWARAGEGAYAQAIDEARRDGRGVFGPAPADVGAN